MRICMISDTHNQHDKLTLPEADVLVHAGDWTGSGKMAEVQTFARWFDSQKQFKHRIAIAGNHDFVAEAFMKTETEYALQDMFGQSHYLRDSGVQIESVFFYGSPWQPRFFDWAFNADRGPDIARHWAKIPHDTNVLITHGPPFMIRDQPGNRGHHVGCDDLLHKVCLVQPKIHVFGHIHGGYGQTTFQDTKFVNASVVDESYKVVNAPIVVEI